MRNKGMILLLLLAIVAFAGCNKSNTTTGQSNVRQMPSGTETTQNRTYTTTQSMPGTTTAPTGGRYGSTSSTTEKEYKHTSSMGPTEPSGSSTSTRGGKTSHQNEMGSSSESQGHQ